jgi:hypothetical protein
MIDRTKAFGALFLLAWLVIFDCASGALAQDAVWHVGKSSGDVWLSASSGVQQVSLGNDAILKPGDSIRTGRNGRVLLTRGEETILISPNSVVGIPTEPKDGLSTTIIQQAGSILLEVERRNVKHFEVETPYLAAVVKGTQFRVSVNRNDASVDVLRGQVEVAELKSGQYALVLPGQAAKVSGQGRGGLSLSGTGTFNPIEKGEPRPSSVKLVPVPKEGLSAPGDGPRGQQVRMASAIGAHESLPASSGGPGGPSPSGAGSSNPIRKGEASWDGLSREQPARMVSAISANESLPASAGGLSPSGAGTSNPIRKSEAPKDGLSQEQPARMASAPTQAGSPISSPEDSAGQKNGWSYDLLPVSNGVFGPADHRRNREEDITFDLVLCAAVGAGVALAVAIQRRWRRRRQAPA